MLFRSSVQPGDTMRHEKWGEGVVLEVMGEGDDREAMVRFDGGEEKRLLLAWAPIEKVG